MNCKRGEKKCRADKVQNAECRMQSGWSAECRMQSAEFKVHS